MKVRMKPDLATAGRGEGGINTIVRAYHALASQYDIEFVDMGDYDVEAIHAAAAPFFDPAGPNLSMNHGLYWANSQKIGTHELRENMRLVENIRHARVVTTPSDWVAQTMRRDMRINPVLLPHGVDWEGWQHSADNEGYVIWNKNRMTDVCSPEPVNRLAARRPNTPFMSTLALNPRPDNVVEIGRQQYEHMKVLVQRSAVYMATQQETWGIGTVEAMAAGKPILGFAFGNNPVLVEHGVNGYLAQPGDWDDLANGLDYCLAHARVLGDNGREMARQYTWERAMSIFRRVCEMAMEAPKPTASVVIPCYNKEGTIGRAIRSALAQDHLDEVIVVDDGSTDGSAEIIKELVEENGQVRYVYKKNGGVASARNRGVRECNSDYFVLLDGDDHIHPSYIAATLPHIVADNSLGVVYTGLRWTDPDGRTGTPPWPGEYDFDAYLKRSPQVSTCALVRKRDWDRLGGQRDRYCERSGAGSEDAEFWFRAGLYGVGFKRATDEPLFEYSSNLGVTSRPGYQESDWLAFHSVQDTGRHPMASLATPEKFSHPIIARDRPSISVIIPVGPGHEQHLVDALDSVDGQSYDRWEAIVVNDTGARFEKHDWWRTTYPHIQFIETPEGGPKGTGWVRNLGVRYASGSLLYFLDADDYLKVNAFELLMKEYLRNEGDVAVYSDYFGVTKILPDELSRVNEKIVFHDPVTHKLVVAGKQQKYDCEIAQTQPTDPPYFWAIASSLIPRAWHDEIGGFDEEIPTWEDCLYFIRLARRGKCFVHVPEMLYVYNLLQGSRNQMGKERHQELGLFDILREKRGPIMSPCNCSEKVPDRTPTDIAMDETPGMIFALYNPPGRGKHAVWGLGRHRYGHFQRGQKFNVRKSDVKAYPTKFLCPECGRKFSTVDEARGIVECDCQAVPEVQVVVGKASPVVPPPPAPFLTKTAMDDFTIVPGIGDRVQERLNGGGITTFRQLRQLKFDELKDYGIVGVWPKRVQEWVRENAE